MRVLVCGGRDFGCVPVDTLPEQWPQAELRARQQRQFIVDTLDALKAERQVSVVIHGGQRGADLTAGYWARRHDLGELPFKAKWRSLGPAAGPIRNQQMMDVGKPDLVVAFPGGRGTADMVDKAHKAGVPVQRPSPLPPEGSGI